MTADGNQPPFELVASRGFVGWLDQVNCSLAFSTYLAGKLFLIGRNDRGGLSIFERSFQRPMGLWSNGDSIYLGTLFQLWRLENCLAQEQLHDGYDRLYVPRMAWTTGDLDIHDIHPGEARGCPYFVNTRFSCLSKTSETHSFTPVWKPDFISRLAAEDRCHLNGMATRDGRPYAVTAVATTDVTDGWREQRTTGGICLSVAEQDVLASGLSMPHSPRWHEGRIWLHESGSGHLGYVDDAESRFRSVTFCPGFLRGLDFVGDYAVVGLSLPRERRTFGGLALESELRKRNAQARCGIMVINLVTSDIEHWLRIDGTVSEIYDVAILKGVKRPMALGLLTDEITRIISAAQWEALEYTPTAPH